MLNYKQDECIALLRYKPYREQGRRRMPWDKIWLGQYPEGNSGRSHVDEYGSLKGVVDEAATSLPELPAYGNMGVSILTANSARQPGVRRLPAKVIST